jgi:hypothetical protein
MEKCTQSMKAYIQWNGPTLTPNTKETADPVATDLEALYSGQIVPEPGLSLPIIVQWLIWTVIPTLLS